MPSYDELKANNSEIRSGVILTSLKELTREPFRSGKGRRWKVLPKTESPEVDYDDLYIVNVDRGGKKIGGTQLVKTTENLWEQT